MSNLQHVTDGGNWFIFTKLERLLSRSLSPHRQRTKCGRLIMKVSSPGPTSERWSNYLKYISVSFYIKHTFLVACKLKCIFHTFNIKFSNKIKKIQIRSISSKDNGNFDWWFLPKYLMFDNVKSIQVWDNLSEG